MISSGLHVGSTTMVALPSEMMYTFVLQHAEHEVLDGHARALHLIGHASLLVFFLAAAGLGNHAARVEHSFDAAQFAQYDIDHG